jgi:hypothetical protein
MRIGIDRTLHSAEDLGDCLPLVEKNRLLQVPDRRVRVGSEGGRLPRSVKAHEGRRVTRRCGRLPRGTRPDE